MTAIQTTFTKKLAPQKRRCLMALDAVRQELELPEHKLDDVLKSGVLAYVWDIGTGEHRGTLKVLPDCVEHYHAHGSKPFPLSEPEVFTLLLPPGHQKPFVENLDLQFLFGCSSDHVLNLVRAGDLKLLAGTSYHRGPKGSALITVDSFREFMTTRRMK